jgi:hypothetical protein
LRLTVFVTDLAEQDFSPYHLANEEEDIAYFRNVVIKIIGTMNKIPKIHHEQSISRYRGSICSSVIRIHSHLTDFS